MTLSTNTLLLGGIGVLLLAMIVIAAWLSARLRAATRELQRVMATNRRLPAPATGVAAAPRPFGPFWDKQQEVYAGLYARYRRACDAAMPRPGRTPDFGKFSRDELLRYLSRRKVRERDASDAIAALDRGDTFAMTRLMTRLHEKVDQRDASIALDRAVHYGELHELYLSDAVRDAVAALRQRLTPADPAGQPTGERRTQATGPGRASEREIREALAALQRAMREELGGGASSGTVPGTARPRPPVAAEHAIATNVHIDGVRTEHGQ